MNRKLVAWLLSLALSGSAGAAVPEAPVSQVQTVPPLSVAPTQPGKPAWLTPEKEAALVEVRKILREARQVAEGIDAPSKPRETSPPEDRFTREERNKMGLLANIEKAQFRAGDFSASATTMSTDYLAFAQLRYGQVRDAVKSIGRERLLEDGALSFVYELAQAKHMDAAIEVAEAQIKKEPVNPRRFEVSLFALIAREQTRAGDLRARESLQRARLAAKMVGLSNDRALALVRVARAQREMGDRVGSHETLRLALDTAMNAPRGRSAGVLRIIAVAQEESDDASGSVKTFARVFEDEKSLKPNERVQRIAFEACDLALRGYRSSATEMFQAAIEVADGLPVNEQVRIWREIGEWLVKAGNYAAVTDVIKRLTDTARTDSGRGVKIDALSSASVLAARIGDLDIALDKASMLEDGWRKASLMQLIAGQLVKAGAIHNAMPIVQRLSDATGPLLRSQLPEDISRSDGMLANTAKVQAVVGDIPQAVQTLKRIKNQDNHQGSYAYPEIIKLLAGQGNLSGARQVIGHVEKKWLQEIPMASALHSLGRSYAESGASQEGLQWADQMDIDYAKAWILSGVAEGLMNRHGIEKIVMERPEATLRGRCSIG